jgi:hypothetical protein
MNAGRLELRFHLWVPLRTVSLTNQREHWRRRQARTAQERKAVWAAWRRARTTLPKDWLAAEVRLTRIAPRQLDDDNLRGALKGVRDQVAHELQVDDADARVAWTYAQGRGRYEVEIEVWCRT